MEILELEIERYLGKIFTVEPFYGWGWGNFYVKPPVSVEPPKPFVIILKKLFYNQHGLLTGIGNIVSEQNPMRDKWVVFSQRHIGNVSLESKGANFNISILSIVPKFIEEYVLAESEIQENAESIHGYCYIYQSKG